MTHDALFQRTPTLAFCLTIMRLRPSTLTLMSPLVAHLLNSTDNDADEINTFKLLNIMSI